MKFIEKEKCIKFKGSSLLRKLIATGIIIGEKRGGANISGSDLAATGAFIDFRNHCVSTPRIEDIRTTSNNRAVAKVLIELRNQSVSFPVTDDMYAAAIGLLDLRNSS